MKTMSIQWQRLVDSEGKTCERCACTENATETAVSKLRRSLAELGIELVLEKQAIGPKEFQAEPLRSNQITIEGRTLEAWLGGTTGHSPCCGPCGDNDCRTVTIDRQLYEAVPETIILRAGLLAAAELLK